MAILFRDFYTRRWRPPAEALDDDPGPCAEAALSFAQGLPIARRVAALLVDPDDQPIVDGDAVPPASQAERRAAHAFCNFLWALSGLLSGRLDPGDWDYASPRDTPIGVGWKRALDALAAPGTP